MSRLRGVGLLLACLGFVAVGVFILVSPDAENKWSGWAAIVFFGFGVVVFGIQLFRERPDLILSDEGLRLSGDAEVTWSEVESVGVRRVAPGRAGDLIEVVLRDPRAYVARLTGAAALRAKANLAAGFSPVQIPFFGRRTPHDAVLAAMRRHHPDLVIVSYPAEVGHARRFNPRRLAWIAFVVVAGVALIWWLENSGDVRTASVGSCLAIQGDDGSTAKLVDCGASDARYKVVGKVKPANDEHECDPYPETAARFPLEKFVLCLALNTR